MKRTWSMVQVWQAFCMRFEKINKRVNEFNGYKKKGYW
jgi:hypothetical protein